MYYINYRKKTQWIKHVLETTLSLYSVFNELDSTIFITVINTIWRYQF